MERITVHDDGFATVKYWTPSEYSKLFPYLQPTKINERIDALNSALYAEAIRYCLDVKAPHSYGVLIT